MSPAEWQAHIDTHLRKEARALAWEARLHGLRHKSKRALSADDFLPKHLRSVDPRDTEAVFDAFRKAIDTAHAHAAAKQRGTLLTPL